MIMENSNINPQNKDANSHPKPTDDVQMDIETVTPETEKEGLPNDQKHNHAPERLPMDELAKEKDTTDNHDAADAKEPIEETEAPGDSEGNTGEANNEKSEESPKKPGDDKRDEIETTSP